MADSTSATPLTAAPHQSQSGFGATSPFSDPEKQVADVTAVTKIPKYESSKLKVLLLVAILGAVTIHACNLYTNGFDQNVNPGVADFNTFIQLFLAQGTLRSCVPMCFVISGLLFFVHRPDDAPEFQFGRRISARVKSLGVPYFLWNVIAAVQLYALLRVPAVFKWYPDHRFAQPTWYTLLVDMWEDPAAGQLWYLRDLLLMVLLTPLLHRLFRVHHSVLLLVPMLAVVPWVLGKEIFGGWCFHSVCPKLTFLRPDSIIFFTTGCYLALRGLNLERRLAGPQAACLALAWLGFVLLKVALILVKTEGEKTPAESQRILAVQRVAEPLGIVAMWYIYDHLHPYLSTKAVWSWVEWLSNFSMWIYCSHFPLASIWVAVGRNLLLEQGAGPMAFLMLFLATPVVFVTAGMVVGFPLSTHCPTVFGLLTGGRGG